MVCEHRYNWDPRSAGQTVKISKPKYRGSKYRGKKYREGYNIEGHKYRGYHFIEVQNIEPCKKRFKLRIQMLASSHVQTIYEIYCQADIFSQKKFTTAHHTLLHSFE